LNELTLRTIAWLHDTGNSHDQKNHIKYSLLIAKVYFIKNGFNYTPSQIEQIYGVIEIHNSPDLLKTPIERAFLEADVLGAITTNKYMPRSFQDGASYTGKLVHEIEKFETEEGKKQLRKHIRSYIVNLHELPLM